MTINEYYASLKFCPSYKYFIPEREYVMNWQDYVFPVEIELQKDNKTVAVLFFTVYHISLMDDKTLKSFCLNIKTIAKDIEPTLLKQGCYAALSHLFVVPEARGQGIGHFLLNSLPEMLIRLAGWKVALLSASPLSFEARHMPDGQWEFYSYDTENDIKAGELFNLYQKTGFFKSPNTFLWFKKFPNNGGEDT